MARRRSRKNADATRRQDVAPTAAADAADGSASAGGGTSLADAPVKNAPGNGTTGERVPGQDATGKGKPGKDAPRGADVPEHGGGVRLSTCIAGMLLTLILGLYLGSLLPGILRDMRNSPTATAPARVQVAETAPPATAEPGAATAPHAPTEGGTAGAGAPSAHALPPELAAQLAALEAAVRKDPDSAATWAELGNLFFDAGRVRESINAYERSLSLSPGNADVLTDLGIMYREDKAPEKAVECFRKALAANPRHENALFNAGVVLYTDLGRREEAVAAWRRLLGFNPQARAPDGRTVSEMVRRLEEPSRR